MTITTVSDRELELENRVAELEEKLDLKTRKLKALSHADALEGLYQAGVEQEREIMHLEAELAALKNQEPIAWMLADALDSFKCGNIVEVSRGREESDDIPLYAAAGAKEKTE